MEIELPVHETTGLTALGFRKNGAPIWPILGGSGEGGDPGAGGSAGGEGGAGDGNQGNPVGGSEDDEDDASKITDEESKKILRKWENRAKSNKTALDATNQQLADLKNQSQAQLDKIAIALGLKQEQATPEELQKALQESQGKIDAAVSGEKAAKIELGVFKAAAKVPGSDPSELLDKISFMKKAGELDPASDKFAAEMEKLVKDNTKAPQGGSGGFSTPVGGGSAQGGSGNNETDPRKLADRISRGGSGLRTL